MTGLFAHIEERAVATPRLTAVRMGGQPVTNGDLHHELVAYAPVLAGQGMSERATLAAALMSLLPQNLRGLPPMAQGEWVAAAARWLYERFGESPGASLRVV